MLYFKSIPLYLLLLLLLNINCHHKGFKTKIYSKINKIRFYKPIQKPLLSRNISIINNYNSNEDIAIIGAGPSGIIAAKSSLEYNLKPKVFEKSNSIGGIWDLNNGKVWENMRTNISKYTNCFSDFPWNEDSDMFPLATDANKYLNDYCKYFDIYKYIQFNSCIINIERDNKKWKIEYKIGDKTRVEYFPFVIVGTGISSIPFISFYDELNKYKGNVIHSQNYHNPKPYKNQNVAVIGGSYSGVEISADLAKETKNVYHIISKPMFILPKFVDSKNYKKPIPLDLLLFYRKNENNIKLTFEEENRISNKFLWDLCKE